MLRLIQHARFYATRRPTSKLTPPTKVSWSVQPRQPEVVAQQQETKSAGGENQSEGPSRSNESSRPLRESAWRLWLSDVRWLIRWTVKWMIGLGVPLHLFTTHFYAVSAPYGASMLPTMHVEGEWLVRSKWHRRGRDCQVGDLVTFKHPIMSADGVGALKRIIGMPGDFVLCETPTHSDKMMQVPAGHCFVAGDNQLHSRDSRHFGALPLAMIDGKVTARFLPWRRSGWFRSPLKPI